MPALIVIGCIILFFVVLFTVHINVRIAMSDDMTLTLKVFGIPIKILPKKPKTYNPKDYTLKKIRKRDAKAAEKAAKAAKAPNSYTVYPLTLKTFSTIGQRFTFAGDTGKDQRVYFFNTKEIMGNKYGTANPVPFRVVDHKIGLDLDVSIRCSGVYSYRIADPLLFYAKVCGNVSGVDGSAADGVEIDIIESIGNDWGACNSALHWDGYGDDHKQVSSGELYNHGIYDGEFHTFALERTADGYIFYIDGKETWRATPDMCAPCPVDGYLKLTVEAADWAGAGKDASINALPADMVVDYVRVYKEKPQ